MLNFLIAYDNIDALLGEYMNSCFQDLEPHLTVIDNKNLITINGLECNEGQIELHTESFNGERFIFVGLSHGRKDSLTAAHMEYINMVNAVRFQNSFFYTCACLSALELGPKLRSHGCLVYIGYNKEVMVPNTYADNFKKCKTSGLIHFLTSGQTVGDSLSHMKDVYEKEYEYLSTQTSDGFIAAALLKSNLTSLVCLGDESLTLNDFRLQ